MRCVFCTEKSTYKNGLSNSNTCSVIVFASGHFTSQSYPRGCNLKVAKSKGAHADGAPGGNKRPARARRPSTGRNPSPFAGKACKTCARFKIRSRGGTVESIRSRGNHLLLIENQPDDESIKREPPPPPPRPSRRPSRWQPWGVIRARQTVLNPSDDLRPLSAGKFFDVGAARWYHRAKNRRNK